MLRSVAKFGLGNGGEGKGKGGGKRRRTADYRHKTIDNKQNWQLTEILFNQLIVDGIVCQFHVVF